jgi:hypothetical protein
MTMTHTHNALPELLPCPFCGSEKHHVMEPTARREDKYDPTDRLFPVVRCASCFVDVLGNDGDFTCVSAIAAWNRRASAGREAVAWQCRARWGDGWTEWQECSKEQFDEKLPLTGYCSDELETEFRALYTTPSHTAPELPKQGEGGRDAVRWECREQHPATGEWGDWKLIDKVRFDHLQYLAGKHSYGVHFETRELFTSQQESGAHGRPADWEYRVRGSNEEWVRGEGEINPLWDQDYWEVRLLQPTPTTPELPKQGEGGGAGNDGDAEELAQAVEGARSHIGSRRPDDADDALFWDRLTRAANMLRALAKRAEGV